MALPWSYLVGAELLHKSGQRYLITAIEERQWPTGPLIEVCMHEEPTSQSVLYNIASIKGGIFKALFPTIEQASLLIKIIAQIEQVRSEQERFEYERQETKRIAQEQANLQRLRDDPKKRVDYITFLTSIMMNRQRADENSIRSLIAERNIPCLVHFTQIENISSILQNGILPRTLLAPGYHFNDEMRLDGFSESISLSISFPNWQMFYRCRCAERSRGPWNHKLPFMTGCISMP